MSSKTTQKASNVFGSLEMVTPYAGGIDLGSNAHFVSIHPQLVSDGESATKVFSGHTAGLQKMVEWLKTHKVTTVAMEATGVYWMGPFEVLEENGIEVCLVNARHLKNVTGRKTDVMDSQWLQQLHSYGLLRPSFVPGQEVRDLRSYVRQRNQLVSEKSRAMLHIHKALDLMNVKVHHEIKNMDGPTGMKILRAISEGQTNALLLADFHSRQLKVSKEELQSSLQGNYRTPHVFALQLALERFDFLAVQIQRCELEIETLLSRMTYGLDTDHFLSKGQTAKPKKRKPKKNDYQFELRTYLKDLAGVDLCAIDGLSENTVLTILSEVGTQVAAKWPTPAHFVSWLRLNPNPKISGGKIMGYYSQKGANPASQAFRLAARSMASSKSALGAFYRKKRSQRGPKIANKATARKIAVIFYLMLSRQEPYVKLSDKEYTEKQKALKIKRLQKEAQRLGLKLERA